MRDMLKIVSDPAHPLHFLVTRKQLASGKIVFDWRKTTRITKLGKVQVGRYEGSELGQVVQAGHLSARASGEVELLALEDANLNQATGDVIEKRRKNIKGLESHKVGVVIKGVPVELRSAKQWVRDGNLPELYVNGGERIMTNKYQRLTRGRLTRSANRGTEATRRVRRPPKTGSILAKDIPDQINKDEHLASQAQNRIRSPSESSSPADQQQARLTQLGKIDVPDPPSMRKTSSKLRPQSRGLKFDLVQAAVEELISLASDHFSDADAELRRKYERLIKRLQPEILKRIDKKAKDIEASSRRNQVFAQVVVEYVYEDQWWSQNNELIDIRLKDFWISTRRHNKKYNKSRTSVIEEYSIPLITQVQGDIEGVFIAGIYNPKVKGGRSPYAVYIVKCKDKNRGNFHPGNISIEGYEFDSDYFGKQHRNLDIKVTHWDGWHLQLTVDESINRQKKRNNQIVPYIYRDISLVMDDYRNWGGSSNFKRIGNGEDSIWHRSWEDWLRFDYDRDPGYYIELKNKVLSTRNITHEFQDLWEQRSKIREKL